LPNISAYPNRLRSMLKSLVDNGVEAMNTKGWTRRDLSIRTRSGDGEVVVEIEDSGPGVSSELRLKAFEPFYSTKKGNGHHLGTGLPAAQQVAIDHGGSIELSNAHRGGCVAQVILPLRRNG
jgi:protein-histidine pros-kinase